MPPDESDEYLANVEKLIEDMYRLNGDRKVILVCHSMGCLYSYYLLRQHPQAWKDQYIQSWITIGAPFGGAVKALEAVASGINFHTELFRESGLRSLEKTFSSMSLLLPSATVFSNASILSLGGKNYTSDDYEEIFELINDTAGFRMWQQSSQMITDYEHPGVEVHCLRGANKPTPERLSYPTLESFPASPLIHYGNGDGTVNQASSDVCLAWDNNGKHDFSAQKFAGVKHTDLVRHADVVYHVTEHVLHTNMRSR